MMYGNKLEKLLVLLSIVIPLSIVMMVMLKDGKELLVKVTQLRDYQLLEKVSTTIINLQRQIEQNNLSTILKNNINHYKRKQHKRNPLEVYDKLIFNIYMLNLNNKQQPINRQRLSQIESQVINHFKQHTYIKDIIQPRRVQNNNQSTEINTNRQQIITINIKPSHISQIEHNYQNKLIQLYEKSCQKQNNNNNKASQYYIDSIMKQLKNTNKMKHCHYKVSNTHCKEHNVYIVYSDNQYVDEIVDGMGDGVKGKQGVGVDQFYQYWTTQDNTETLIVMPINQISSSAAKSLQFLNFLTTIEQLIYQALHISELIQQTHKIYTQSSLINNQDDNLKQAAINQFIQLNKMYKQLNILKQIQQIVNNTDIPYVRINDEQRQLLMNELQMLCGLKKQNDTINQSTQFLNHHINRTSINMLTRIDTFPTDYKLGSLAPIAIILIYPLFSIIPYLRN